MTNSSEALNQAYKKTLKPIIKWTGGKRRELPIILKNTPLHSKYVEPFIGGGAVYFTLSNKISVINDYDYDLINFYNQVPNILDGINNLKNLNGNHDAMEMKYYECRDIVNDKSRKDPITRALAFVYVNQLAFSGMRRFSSVGNFNVPFGHYKAFNPIITDQHIDLLKNTVIRNDSAMSIIKEYDEEDCFIFLDPPYTRVFNKYSSGNSFGMSEQISLRDQLNGLNKSKWMLIINEDPELKEMYKNFNIEIYPHKYGVNIKNRFNTNVNHLLIKNY
jgi:DNA adenine methylase